MTQCPDGYYGTVTFTCASCSASSQNICDDPLTFTTETSIENYQYVVRIKFNHEVSIAKQIEEIMQIKLQITRRMLDAVTDLINSGVPYTYEILSDGTIKVYLLIETSLNDPVFVVQFTDPTAITSVDNGGTLQDTDREIFL